MATYVLLLKEEAYCLAVYDNQINDVRMVGEGKSLEDLALNSKNKLDSKLTITTSHAFTHLGFHVSVDDIMRLRELIAA